MNWGWRIFIIYTGFVIMVLLMVGFAMTQDVFMVEKDYYKKEIAYQDQIDRKNNVKALDTSIAIEYAKGDADISFQFPLEIRSDIKGQIHFYRPSDDQYDRHIAIALDTTGTQRISLDDMPTGLWQLRLSWTANGKEYYYEQELIM